MQALQFIPIAVNVVSVGPISTGLLSFLCGIHESTLMDGTAVPETQVTQLHCVFVRHVLPAIVLFRVVTVVSRVDP